MLFRLGVVLLFATLMSSCASVQKKVKAWGGSGASSKEKKEEKPAVVRPSTAKGLVPSSDRAAHAAQKLHRELNPGQSGKRVISMVKGDVAVVKIYLDAEKEGSGSKKTKPVPPPMQYWVGRKGDGLWYAYNEVPLKEDFKFVFEEISKGFLAKKHAKEVQVHDFNLIEGGGAAREVRMRYSVAGEVFVKRLDFKKSEDRGWSIEKDEPIKSVY